MSSNTRFYGIFGIILLIIIGWAVFFYFVSPSELVDKIGIRNSYLVAFILALVCGFSSLTGSTFYVALAALAHGGANPLILGLTGGIGLCISDALFYYVITQGVNVLDKHWQKLTNAIKKWMNWAPDWAVGIFVFLYSAFAPIPNDIILVALAVCNTSFKKIVPFLFVGDIVSCILLAYISR